MLQLQYRMVEEICHFPSQHFYHGELQSAQDVGKRGRPGLCPFLVFDVQGGKEESRDRSSLCNTTECSMVSELCHVVCGEVRENRIGVITPYKAQEKLLKQKLATLSQIEVGTVDSFQGREKDVIILSCVRAKAFDGSIGFLSDQKRMNVALTRAKFGLYIVCHKNTLRVNPTWRELIEHAETRNAFVAVPTGRSFQFYSTKILRPKQATATVSAPSGVEPSRSKTHSDPSASSKNDAHDRVVGVTNSCSVCHKNSQEHRSKEHSTTEDGSCSHFEDGNHCHTESAEINCQSKSTKEDDFHSREVGDNTGQSRGKGDNTAQSRGKGDNDGQSRGKGHNTAQSRGKGDNTAQSRGKGDNDGQSRGKGDNDGQSKGKGVKDGHFGRKGDKDGQSRQEVDVKGHSIGKGGRDCILSEMQGSKSDVDFARPTSGVEVRNALGTSGISSRLTDSRSSTGEPGLATNHLSNSHEPTQHKMQPLVSDPRRKTIPRSSQSGGRYANQHSDHTHHTRWENPSTTSSPAVSTRPSQYSHSTHTPLPAVGMPSPFVQQYSETSRHPISVYSPSDKLWPRQPGQLSDLGFNPGRRDRVSYVNYGGNVPIRRPHYDIKQPARIPRRRPPSTREIILRGIHRKR